MQPEYVSRDGSETVKAWRYLIPVAYPVPPWVDKLSWTLDLDGTMWLNGQPRRVLPNGSWLVERNGLEIWPDHAFRNAFILPQDLPRRSFDDWPTARKPVEA